jgi:hypothetical protein
MLIDNKLVFSDHQHVTASAASSDILDFGVANADLGEGSGMCVRFIVETTFASGNGTATLTIALQDSATDWGGAHVLVQGEAHAIGATTLIKGVYLPEMKIPDQHLQFMRLYYTAGTENFNAGAITAWVDVIKGMRHR